MLKLKWFRYKMLLVLLSELKWTVLMNLFVISLRCSLKVPISLQPEAASDLPPPVPTDHCGDRVRQPALWDRSKHPVTPKSSFSMSEVLTPSLLFHCQQDTREYEVSIWEVSEKTFLDRPPSANSSSSPPAPLCPGGGNVNTTNDVQPLLPRDAATDPVLSSPDATAFVDLMRNRRKRGAKRCCTWTSGGWMMEGRPTYHLRVSHMMRIRTLNWEDRR